MPIDRDVQILIESVLAKGWARGVDPSPRVERLLLEAAQWGDEGRALLKGALEAIEVELA